MKEFSWRLLGSRESTGITLGKKSEKEWDQQEEKTNVRVMIYGKDDNI